MCDRNASRARQVCFARAALLTLYRPMELSTARPSLPAASSRPAEPDQARTCHQMTATLYRGQVHHGLQVRLNQMLKAVLSLSAGAGVITSP